MLYGDHSVFSLTLIVREFQSTIPSEIFRSEYCKWRNMENNKWLLQFHRMVARGNIKMIKTSLEVKPDDVSIDSRHKNSLISTKTALEHCCLVYIEKPTNKMEKIIHLLLQYGADPLQRRSGGWRTCILYHLCITRGTDNIVMEFLRNIKDIDYPIYRNYNALIWSLGREKEDALKYCLTRGADPNRNEGGITPLHTAISNNVPRCIEKIRILIENGADINMQASNGNTPLHLALAHPEGKDMCIFLLEHKPDVHAVNNLGRTPLFDYLPKDHLDLEVLEDLLKCGSDPNVPNRLGLNSLHLAMSPVVIDKITEVAKLLIKHGASVNQKDLFGNTSLHYAAFFESGDLVRTLLMNGADLSVRNKDGYIPMDNFIPNSRNCDVALAFFGKIMLDIHSGRMTMTNKILAKIQSSDAIGKIVEECNTELLDLKKQRIGDTTITLFQVLVSSAEQISKFAGNHETFEILSRIEVQGFYGPQLKRKILTGLERRELEDISMSFFSNSSCNELAYIAVRRIVNHLAYSDLAKLTNVMVDHLI